MQPVRSLPENYVLHREIDLSKDLSLMLKLNLLGAVLFFVFAWAIGWLASLLRPQLITGSFFSGEIEVRLSTIVFIIISFAVVLIVHEAVHGLFFWIFTRSRPVFGLKAAYAYAAAPGWYIPRNPYLLIGLSPLVVITLVGMLLLPVIPDHLLLPWLFALVTNASGAVGDLYVVGWLLSRPPDTLVQDRGDGMNIFNRQPGRAVEPAGYSPTSPAGDNRQD